MGAQPDRRVCLTASLSPAAGPELAAGLSLAAGWGLAAVSALWSVVTYFSIRASGVTGSDPYAYVQMAVDLARHSTLLHTFPLAPQLAAWNLPTWPAVPVGYRPPDLLTGQAATVWPPGYAVFLALAYLAASEAGLYLLPPLMGCLALAALWALCLEVLRNWPVGQRFLAAGLAVFVLATSYRQIEGAALPMADIPSQLFTLLAVYGALRAGRAGQGAGLIWAALSGLCLGIAFSIRYTQVLLAFSLFFLLAACLRPGHEGWRAFILRLLAFGAAAWLSALPALWYHTLAFGHPFAVGSAELGLFGWAYLPRTATNLARELFRTNEFLYLLPFLFWGLIRMGRSLGRESTALALWLGVLLAFHLPYPALRVRDLLSVFPVLALWIGAGAADMLTRVSPLGTNGDSRSSGRKIAPALLVAGMAAVLFGARVRLTLQWPLHAARFNTFGYLNARQRAAFDDLQRLVPSEAVLAASLNSGAANLYSQRNVVRPSGWPADEWRRFVRLTRANGQEIYLLVDGEEMQPPRQALEPGYTLELLARLDLPYFYPDGSSDNRLVDLYQIKQ